MKSCQNAFFAALVILAAWCNCAIPAHAATYEASVQYTVQPGETYPLNLSMWVPDDAPAVRGAIVYCHGLASNDPTAKSSFQTRTYWQKLAREQGFALIGLRFTAGDPNADADYVSGTDNDPMYTPQAVSSGIDELATASGRDELKTCPLSFYGFSAGSGFSLRAAKYFTSRAIAASHNKGLSIEYIEGTALSTSVPCAISFGTLDTDSRNISVRRVFREHRGYGEPWMIFPDRGVSHTEYGDSHSFAMLFLDRMITTRVQGGGEVGKTPVLAAITPSASYLGNNADSTSGTWNTLFGNLPTYATATAIGTDPNFSWMQDEDLAAAWQAVCAANRWGSMANYYVEATAGQAKTITLTAGTAAATKIDWYVGAQKVASGDATLTSYTFTPTAGVSGVHVRVTLADSIVATAGLTVVVAQGDASSQPAWKTRQPGIRVQGNSQQISNGDSSPVLEDHTDFNWAYSGNTIDRTFSITNTGGQTLTLSNTPAVVVEGAEASAFSVTSQPASTSLGSGETVNFTIRYTASGDSQSTATVRISSNATNDNPFTFSIKGVSTTTGFPEIAMSGNGATIVCGDASPSATDHTDFGTQEVGVGTQDRTFTISNTGAADLLLSGTPRVSLTGSHVSDFAVTVQPAASVAANGSTTFTVRFQPKSVGTRTAVVRVENNDSDEAPFTFTLQGTSAITTVWDNVSNTSDGTSFPFTIAAGSYAAQKFQTDAGTLRLHSVKLMLKKLASGNMKVVIYSHNSGSDLPDQVVATVYDGTTDAAGLTSNYAAAVFDNGGAGLNITLSPSTVYWLVLQNTTAATVDWDYTTNNTGSGIGFLTRNVFSSNSGSTWSRIYAGEPMRMTLSARRLYTVSVSGGTGGGTCAVGDAVTLSAGTAPAGQVFYAWTGDTGALGDAASPTATLTMPASAVSLTANFKVPDTYALWKAYQWGHGASDATAGPTADPNGNGLSNILEYALGHDPKNVGSAAAVTQGTTHSSGSTYLTLTYRKPADRTDVSYVIEQSSDGTTWTAVDAASCTVSPAPANDTDGTPRVSVRDNTPLSGGSPRFLRLRVVVP